MIEQAGKLLVFSRHRHLPLFAVGSGDAGEIQTVEWHPSERFADEHVGRPISLVVSLNGAASLEVDLEYFAPPITEG